jgi:hypothetical protein
MYCRCLKLSALCFLTYTLSLLTLSYNYILNPANKHLNLGVYTFTQQTNTYEAGPIQQAQIY